MNQPDLNSRLDDESSRLRRFYLIGVLGILISAILVIAALTATNGTQIEVTPNEAQETANITVSKGLGLYLSGAIYSLSGTPEITVSAQGYETKTEDIPASSLGKNHRIELRELPGRLTVEVSPSLPQTAWFLNGQNVEIGPRLEKDLYSGDYILEIVNPFFERHEERISIVRQKEHHLNVALQPFDGLLAINSVPPNATVKIDGQEIGRTPVKIPLKGGEYSVEVGGGDYTPSLENIRLTQDHRQQNRTYQLAIKKGYVTVHVSPAGGKLLLNGIKVDPDMKLALDAIHPNKLTYLKPGYHSKTISFSLVPNEEKQVSFELKPETGLVEFRSTPSAEVLIDGKSVGLTPLKKELSSVSHKVVFRKPGYRSISKKVLPTSSSDQLVDVILETELSARLTEAPTEYVNSAGVKLKLFKPGGDQFEMGAPRSEKGQRANEIIRKIVLNKPFYTGFYEVTNQQFSKFDIKAGSGNGDLPVTNIGWIEAAKFCNWLSQQEKLTPFYNIDNQVTFNDMADGYRLLSEAEWEWLARKAGKATQTRFTWGNDPVIPPKTVNVADESAKGHVRLYVPQYTDGFAGIAPVGSFIKEPSGLFDLGGNVSEWVHDYYAVIPSGSSEVQTDPLGGLAGSNHTIKGANWQSGTLTELRPAFRDGFNAGRDNVGFRIGRYLYGGEGR